MSTDLAVIEAALKAATPGPWETWPHTHLEDGCRCLSCQFVTVWQTRNGIDCEDVARKPGESERCEAAGYSWEDANLIANAPSWLAELVERVRLLEGAIDGIRSSARTDRFACCACCLEEHDADSELVNNHILPCNICQDPWKARAEAAEEHLHDLAEDGQQHRNRALAAEAAIERVRAAVADHPGSAWDSGIKLRAEILRALDGDAKRCTSDITLRDEEHRLCRCTLTEGHAGVHDDGAGTTWTGGDA